jgi:N-acetyl-gamma-glutamyl-phosphate reductase
MSSILVDQFRRIVDATISQAKIPSVQQDFPSNKRFRVGIVGVSGYGGGEALRLCATHPLFDLVYVAGEGSAGQNLVERFPGIGDVGHLTIQKWDPHAIGELDVLFASLPSGDSKEALAKVRPETRIVDIGGDHRYADGWTYGLADVWPEQIRGKTRVANPGCYPSATLAALAPLIASKLIDPAGIIVDAKSGVSGAGRGGGSTFGYAEVNEDVSAYGLFKHAHVAEMNRTISKLAGSNAELTFTPHLIPMTRGILATCYGRGKTTTAECIDAARKFYEGRPFVRVVEKAPHTKWATGSNLVYVSYAADAERGLVIALGAIDNLGKGAAGQAVQNANLMLGISEAAGLAGTPLWP